MPQHLIHLICGSTGAGKTTYAIRLTDQIGAVRFSIDEWMARLFWMDTPQPIVPAWSLERVERCYAQIWSVAEQVACRGTPAVLDLGFSQSAARARFAECAKDAGLSARLHFVDVPAGERWRRVQSRNERETNQLPFDVTREMFDFVEGMWEPPTEEEMRRLDGVRI